MPSPSIFQRFRLASNFRDSPNPSAIGTNPRQSVPVFCKLEHPEMLNPKRGAPQLPLYKSKNTLGGWGPFSRWIIEIQYWWYIIVCDLATGLLYSRSFMSQLFLLLALPPIYLQCIYHSTSTYYLSMACICFQSHITRQLAILLPPAPAPIPLLFLCGFRFVFTLYDIWRPTCSYS